MICTKIKSNFFLFSLEFELANSYHKWSNAQSLYIYMYVQIWFLKIAYQLQYCIGQEKKNKHLTFLACWVQIYEKDVCLLLTWTWWQKFGAVSTQGRIERVLGCRRKEGEKSFFHFVFNARFASCDGGISWKQVMVRIWYLHP